MKSLFWGHLIESSGFRLPVQYNCQSIKEEAGKTNEEKIRTPPVDNVTTEKLQKSVETQWSQVVNVTARIFPRCTTVNHASAAEKSADLGIACKTPAFPAAGWRCRPRGAATSIKSQVHMAGVHWCTEVRRLTTPPPLCELVIVL